MQGKFEIPSECQKVWIQNRPDVHRALYGFRLFAKNVSRGNLQARSLKGDSDKATVDDPLNNYIEVPQ